MLYTTLSDIFYRKKRVVIRNVPYDQNAFNVTFRNARVVSAPTTGALQTGDIVLYVNNSLLCQSDDVTMAVYDHVQPDRSCDLVILRITLLTRLLTRMRVIRIQVRQKLTRTRSILPLSDSF